VIRWMLREEKIAIAVFALLFVLAFAQVELYRRFWVLGVLGSGLIWFVVIAWAVVRIPEALHRHDAATMRFRSVATIPMAILAAWLLSPAAEWGAVYLHLLTHQYELDAARAQAGPGKAVSIRYIEGVPDGGVAIIDSPLVRPEALTPNEKVRLTNGNMQSCWRLRGTIYACGFG
jgi:hypothetical protein